VLHRELLNSPSWGIFPRIGLRFTGCIQSSPKRPTAHPALVLCFGLSNSQFLEQKRRLHANTLDSHASAGNGGQAAWLPLNGSPRPLHSRKVPTPRYLPFLGSPAQAWFQPQYNSAITISCGWSRSASDQTATRGSPKTPLDLDPNGITLLRSENLSEI